MCNRQRNACMAPALVLLEALFQVECDEGKPRGHYSAGGKFTLAARKIEMGVVRWLFLTLLGWWPSGATRSTYPCDGEWPCGARACARTF
ncbi:Hypothetical protein SMAX5B_002438 [Scophthalmus maximus]|uniref:Secreted protein n=1 Tax=Scophthalmus maximus TaxID=52904 RepID=A0A2U9AVW5_SCOMX|nr:Hypothetical protein SMAX5B_002438 [Scophthalmus maximus]